MRFRVWRFMQCSSVLLAFLACPSMYAAEQPQPLTLQDALSLAQRNNANLLSGKVQLEVADAELTIAKERENPSLLADMGVAERTYRFGILSRLEVGNKRGKRIALARAHQTEIQAHLETEKIQLHAEVRRQYSQLYVLQQQLRLIQPFIGQSNSTPPDAKATTLSTMDHLAFCELENAYDQYQTATAQRQYHLNSLLGLPIQNKFTLNKPDALPLPGTLDEAIQIAQLHRPELLEKQAQIQSATRHLQLERANRIPDLNYSVGLDVVTSPPPSTYGVFVITTIPLPVLSNRRGAIDKFIAHQKATTLETSALRSDITLQVAENYAQVVSTQRIVNRYETEMLPLASQSPNPDLHSPSQIKAWLSLQMGYLQALLDYHNALANLETAMGTAWLQ